jgi:hypothetical protein
VRGLELYCDQVKTCITIALNCVDEDRHKRPNIGDIVRELNEIETMLPLVNMSMNEPVSSVDQVRSLLTQFSLLFSTPFVNLYMVQHIFKIFIHHELYYNTINMLLVCSLK